MVLNHGDYGIKELTVSKSHSVLQFITLRRFKQEENFFTKDPVNRKVCLKS